MRALRAVSALAAVVALVSGCDPKATPGRDLRPLLAACPADPAKFATYIGVDVSGSGQSSELEAEKLVAVHAQLTQAAVCHGHAKVVAFSKSIAATSTLMDADLTPAGQTQTAQLRRVPALVDQQMGKVRAKLTQAKTTLQTDGSDITGQIGLAAEYIRQRSGANPVQANVLVLTDGIQTVGVVLNTPALTATVAADLATRADIAQLPAKTHLTVAGIGKTIGDPAPTTYVEALKTFYASVCKRTGTTTTCLITTDLTTT